MTRIPAPYWLAGLCLAWLLPGLIGHAPWKGPDSETFSYLLAARQQSDWLFPYNAGAQPLYLWVAQGLGALFSPVLPLHDGARLASGFLAGASLLLTALTARRLYGDHAVWPAVLALMGCMGLLVPAHEINPYTAQLASMSLFAYGLARMLTQPLTGGGLAGLGLAGLFLSGAWLAALALAGALLLLPALLVSWRTSSRVGGSWFALIGAFALCGVWLLTVQAKQPERLAEWWQHVALGNLIFAAGEQTDYNPMYFISSLSWFAWPAWPLAGWAVYRLKRGGWDSVKLWMPLGLFSVTLIALSLHARPEQLQTIILLPVLALLAGAGLAELRRGAANALLWFAFMVFSFFALVFWIYWAAFDLGWPAQMASRLAKLGMESQGLRPLALVPGLLVTFAWVGWLVWLQGQPRSTLRPMLAWSAGLTFLWCLLLALFIQPLDARLSYAQVGREIKSMAVDADCIATKGVGGIYEQLLAYHSGLIFKSGNSETCDWLLIQHKSGKAHSPGADWVKRWEGGRPGERNERFSLFQQEQ